MSDFDEFVAASADDLLRTAFLIVWDAGEAEDLVQECLLKVARRWPRVRRMQQRHAYARRILVNLALDGSGRHVRRRAELNPVAAGGEPWSDTLTSFADRSELLQALAELPQRQRAVLVLRYFNDLTEAQTAEVLGCPQGTVKSSAARGLARLREALQPITKKPRSTES